MSDTLATPANMRKFEATHVGSDGIDAEGMRYHVEAVRAVALDPCTGEVFSASSGDYFMLGENESLKNKCDEPLLLVVSITSGYADALTGEKK